MKIGIMGAMPAEVEILRQAMTDVVERACGSRVYYVGMLASVGVVLTFSRWGKVAAATTATTLITEFAIDRLIFTGVAGALTSELNTGDLVVSEILYQHDMNAAPLFPKYEIPLTGMTDFSADQQLAQIALKSANSFLTRLPRIIATELLQQFNITDPKCKAGCIATGDCFVAGQVQVEQLRAAKPQADVVEMEGAAVAQVCTDFNIPFVVIRTVSDHANSKAPVDFTLFVNQVAKFILESAVESRFWMQHLDSSSYTNNFLITNKVTTKIFVTLSKSICYPRKSRSSADSRITAYT